MTTPSPERYEILPGRRVRRIGYGTMQLQRGDDTPAGRRAGAEVLRRAVALGVDHLDTAPFYGQGTVLEVIREALAPYPQDLVIVSKVGAAHRAGQPLQAAQRPEELRAAVEETLRGLGVERVDVVNLRRMDFGPRVAEGDQVVDLDDQLALMAALRDEGKIGAIGLSHVRPADVARALPLGIACVQNAYSLVDRSDEEVLRVCAEQGIAYVPYFPLGSAFPGFPKVVEQEPVRRAAERTGATPAQVGLAWLLQHSPNVLLIPGTATTTHLEENVAAAHVRLDEATVAELDAVAEALPAQG